MIGQTKRSIQGVIKHGVAGGIGEVGEDNRVFLVNRLSEPWAAFASAVAGDAKGAEK